ncbi:unnamed protein product [Blepharisma stoltei]|uniref:Uncharacterized protein n=1 Tax=Blepharisma stoltei TaxID=1481888 RepID=A0AAU9IGX4_9CILI|nr:unnamed protein product [Blepharisma stoltei]
MWLARSLFEYWVVNISGYRRSCSESWRNISKSTICWGIYQSWSCFSWNSCDDPKFEAVNEYWEVKSDFALAWLLFRLENLNKKIEWISAIRKNIIIKRCYSRRTYPIFSLMNRRKSVMKD